MQVDDYTFAAYWGNRKESPSSCAQRLHQLLIHLRSCHREFSHWYRTGKSRRDAASRAVFISRDYLETMFIDPVSAEIESEVDRRLGHSLLLWSRPYLNDLEKSLLRVSCGGYASTVRVQVPNSCVLSIPAASTYIGEVLARDTAINLLLALLEAWNPIWATLIQDSYRSTINRPPHTPVVGELTYLSIHPRHIPRLPSTVSVRQIGANGSLIMLDCNTRAAYGEIDSMLAMDLTRLLDREGLLAPARYFEGTQ
jgi:hypothetical protein